MIVAKSFILSQIVFPAQFTNICTSEIKKIERLVYSYVNGSRNLYGPERIARRYLKAGKLDGGINGIDVNSFLTAIALKQFGKAMTLSRALGALQASMMAIKDDISESALRLEKASLVSFCRDNPIPDLQQLEIISRIPVNSLIKSGTNVAKVADQYGITSLYSIQEDRLQGRIPRSRLNLIIRSLPVSVARLIRAGMIINSQTKHMLITPLTYLDIESVTTKVIRNAIVAHRIPSLFVDLNKIHRRQDLPTHGSTEFSNLYHNIWKLKQPGLRAIRLKVCLKDVFANERRHRFGIADSPNCPVCDQIESVDHQLIDCANAKRLWQIFNQCTGVAIRSMKDIIVCNELQEIEVLKSSIVKLLLQIDRSKNLVNKAAAQWCAHFLRIEATVDRSKSSSCMSLVDKLKAIT